MDVQARCPWIDHGRWFLWTSERDGWRHVYRIARDGGDPTLITTFDADVIEVVGDERHGPVLSRVAGECHATVPYRAPLDGSRPPQRVTPEAESGHTPTISPRAAVWRSTRGLPSTGRR